MYGFTAHLPVNRTCSYSPHRVCIGYTLCAYVESVPAARLYVSGLVNPPRVDTYIYTHTPFTAAGDFLCSSRAARRDNPMMGASGARERRPGIILLAPRRLCEAAAAAGAGRRLLHDADSVL